MNEPCSECGYGLWRGSRGWIPHAPACSHRHVWSRPEPLGNVIDLITGSPADYRRQDAEAASLRRERAPFPVGDHQIECPCEDCEDTRRRFLRRCFGPLSGLAPRGTGVL